jgi:putative ABC transport system permease protein
MTERVLTVTLNPEERPRPAPGQEPAAAYDAISPDYFRALSIPLLRGRFFTHADRSDSLAVAIVNETMARRFWPGEDPIGKRLTIDDMSEMNPREIIGVVADVRSRGLGAEVDPKMYVPYAQRPWFFMSLVVQTKTDPLVFVSSVRNAVWKVDREQVLGMPRTMEQILAGSVATPRFNMSMLSAFAILALVLASIGVYGLVSYTVAQRQREIGIRLALGAQASQIVGPIVRQGLILALAGVALGVALAIGAGSLLSGVLYGFSVKDPIAFAAACLVLVGVTLVATFVPARRARRVELTTAIRGD